MKKKRRARGTPSLYIFTAQKEIKPYRSLHKTIKPIEPIKLLEAIRGPNYPSFFLSCKNMYSRLEAAPQAQANQPLFPF
jgi:hypothetical protein